MVKQEEKIETEGEVIEALPNATFRVKTQDNQLVLAHLSGKMRMYHIRVMPGDKVRLEKTKYDLGKGRITYRYK